MRSYIDLAMSPKHSLGRDFIEKANSAFGLWGAQVGLIQTVLKLMVPSVPDVYQGADLWEQSMVDPDNRRSVDYAQRVSALSECRREPPDMLLKTWQNGLVKMRVIDGLLGLRCEMPLLFSNGTYEPIETDKGAGEVLPFIRRHGEVAICLVAKLQPWRELGVVAFQLPEALRERRWSCLLGGIEPTVHEENWLSWGIDGCLPFEVLISKTESSSPTSYSIGLANPLLQNA